MNRSWHAKSVVDSSIGIYKHLKKTARLLQPTFGTRKFAKGHHDDGDSGRLEFLYTGWVTFEIVLGLLGFLYVPSCPSTSVTCCRHGNHAKWRSNIKWTSRLSQRWTRSFSFKNAPPLASLRSASQGKSNVPTSKGSCNNPRPFLKKQTDGGSSHVTVGCGKSMDLVRRSHASSTSQSFSSASRRSCDREDFQTSRTWPKPLTPDDRRSDAYTSIAPTKNRPGDVR